MERANSIDKKSNVNKHADDRKLPEAWLRFLEAVQQQFSDHQRDQNVTK